MKKLTISLLFFFPNCELIIFVDSNINFWYWPSVVTDFFVAISSLIIHSAADLS